MPTRKGFVYLLSILVLLLVWWSFTLVIPPLFLPSPALTADTGVHMILSGELPKTVGVSMGRILAGWILGGICGAALGIVLGRVRLAQAIFLPVIEYLRFVPPVTLVSLFVIWFGVGETSKIVLIFWTVVFIVLVNTAAGAASVRDGAIRAARCLGASNAQVIYRVVIPETVPFIATGFQIALGNAFMAIVAAEMLAAQSGIGYMIWNAEVYAQIDRMFVGFVTLSIMGFVTDRFVYGVSHWFLAHYRITG
jgi:NitT/TauT family transport system permease protein